MNLAKANRQRLATYTLADRAVAFAKAGDIRRAFRCQRASLRCAKLARKTLLSTR